MRSFIPSPTLGFALLSPVLFFVPLGCSEPSPSESTNDNTELDGPSADRASSSVVLSEARTRFGLFRDAAELPAADRVSGIKHEATLPTAANGAFRIAHETTGVAVSFTLLGAEPEVVRVVEDGYAVYPAGGPDGSDVIAAVSSRGLEDWIVLPRAPEGGELRWRIHPEKARALRLVGGTLEVLDASGSPRVRVAPPWVVDASGARHPAKLDVEGCAVDRDVRTPWGRALTELDGVSCELVVSYDTALPHPVIVDPAWDVAALMAHERTHHTSTLLSDGTVLVVGGFDAAGTAVAQAEILCPEESICPGGVSFATSGSLVVARGGHTDALVGSRVLIAGGRATRGAVTALATTELFDIAAGTFTAGPAMSTQRFGHTSTVLDDGRVLITGGENGTSPSNAEIFDPATTSFGAPIAMTGEHRRGHMAELLGNDMVLIAGGVGAINNAAISSAELFQPLTNSFVATDDMTSPRAWATATRLEDAAGSVLIVGGTNNTGFYYKTVDLFDPTVGTNGTFVQQLIQTQKQRAFHASLKLTGESKILVTGGFDGTVVHDDTEVFDGITKTFIPTLSTTMGRGHDFHTVTRLLTGKAAVIGGGIGGTPTNPGSGTVDVVAASQAVILARENGELCDVDGECRNNHCYHGLTKSVCCNETCTDVCSSCVATDQAAPAPGDGQCAIVKDDTDVSAQCSSDVQLLLQCNAGIIEATNIIPCEPYLCEDGDSCRTSCTTDDHCNDDYFCCLGPDCCPEEFGCEENTCVPRFDEGIVCDHERQCESDNCVDGFCCNSACGEQCQACDVAGFEGQCSQVDGAPHGGRPECSAGDEECRGVCGSNPTKCDYDQTVECGTSTCESEHRSYGLCSLQEEGVCAAADEECGAYACDADGVDCNDSCETVEDCAPKAVCTESNDCLQVDSDQCDGDHTVVRVDGTTDDCSPLKCKGASCIESCESIDDCVSGLVCDAGACIEPPADPVAPEDCSVHGRPASGRGYGAVLALAFGALALMSRRARGGQR